MTTPKRVILHIGTYKTGTTSIQTHLYSVRHALLTEGILYPENGLVKGHYGHHALARFAAACEWGTARHTSDSVLEMMAAEVAASPADTVIISSEELCSLTNPDQLLPLLSPHQLEIFVSLRPQDEFVNAMYYTSLMTDKHGLLPNEYMAGQISKLLDYGAILTRWRTAFPKARIIVRIYEKGRSPRQDALRDLALVLGLEARIPMPDRRVSDHRTLPSRATVALRTLIRAQLVLDASFYQIFTALHAVYSGHREETSVFSPLERRTIMEHCRESNRAVRRQFADGADKDLFAPVELPGDKDWADAVGDDRDAMAGVMQDVARFVLLAGKHT